MTHDDNSTSAFAFDATEYELCLRIAKKVASRFPRRYFPFGRRGNDAYQDITHQWMTEELVGKGHWAYMKQCYQTSQRFHGALRESFQRFLTSSTPCTELDHLRRRTIDLLESHSCFRCFNPEMKKASMKLWGLSVWTAPQPFNGLESRVAYHPDLPVFKRMYVRSDSKKLSPVITNKQLHQLIAKLFECVDALLTVSQIREIIGYRFDLMSENQVASLDQPLYDSATQSSTNVAAKLSAPDEQEYIEIAESICEELTPRQKKILKEYNDNKNYENIAKNHNVSTSTIRNDIQKLSSLFEAHACGVDIEYVLHYLLLALDKK